MRILSIETSCDDTSIAILDNNKVLSLVTHSQIEEHNKFGGIIPELASRYHSLNIHSLIEKALIDSKTKLDQVDKIVVTQGPGLVNSLQIGMIVAKTLAQTLDKPLYTIDHIHSHIYSPFIGKEVNEIPKQFLFLVVSGGHTMLGISKDNKLSVLGQTKDDAIGEAFDKVAKIMGMDYPGGPEIDKRAKNYKGELVSFTPAKLQNFEFSFSGIKSSVLNYTLKNKKYDKDQVSASFQKAAVDQIIFQVKKAVKKYKIKDISISGGVAANSELQERLKKELFKDKINLHFPERKYIIDNAAMIGFMAYIKLKKHIIKESDFEIDSYPQFKEN